MDVRKSACLRVCVLASVCERDSEGRWHQIQNHFSSNELKTFCHSSLPLPKSVCSCLAFFAPRVNDLLPSNQKSIKTVFAFHVFTVLCLVSSQGLFYFHTFFWGQINASFIFAIELSAAAAAAAVRLDQRQKMIPGWTKKLMMPQKDQPKINEDKVKLKTMKVRSQDATLPGQEHGPAL